MRRAEVSVIAVVLAAAFAAGCGGSSLQKGMQTGGASGTGSGGASTGSAGTPGECQPDPSLCAPTYVEQRARPNPAACDENGVAFVGGPCGGYTLWVVESAAGDQTTCLYDDGGALAGERVCGGGVAACSGGAGRCVTSGAAPTPYPADLIADCHPQSLATLCGCEPPEIVSPGACDPMLAQQVARPETCSSSSTGICAGYQYWFQGGTWNMDILIGNQTWCIYDGSGALVGEQICNSLGPAGPACPTTVDTRCHVSGIMPFDLEGRCTSLPSSGNPSTCPGDGGAADGG